MRILKIFICFFFLISSVCLGFEDDLNPPETILSDVPVGMEAIQITNGYRIIAPEGAKIKRVGAQIIVEGDKEYYSRRFHELTQEIKSLKESSSVLKNQIETLNQTVENQQKLIEQITKIEEEEKE